MLREQMLRMLTQTPPDMRRHGLRGSLDIQEDDSEFVKRFKKLKADKWFCHSYIPIYEYLFHDLRYEPVDVLEIGVWRGDSLKVWEEYLPNANVTGVDIDPNCAKIEFQRAVVDIHDQTDYEYFFEKYKRKMFDVVIEDGKHEYAANIMSAAIFHPMMKENGIYIIEDIKGKLKHYSVLQGVEIDLQRFKKRRDDKLLLLPQGEYFQEKAEFVKDTVDSITDEEIESYREQYE